MATKFKHNTIDLEIEAVRVPEGSFWSPANKDARREVMEFLGGSANVGSRANNWYSSTDGYIVVFDADGNRQRAFPGGWIASHEKGEYYPIANVTIEQFYRSVQEPETDSAPGPYPAPERWYATAVDVVDECTCEPCYGDEERIDDNPAVRVTWDGAVFEIYDECLAEDVLRGVFGRGDE